MRLILSLVVSVLIIQLVDAPCSEEQKLPQLRIKEVIEVTKDSDTLGYGVFDYMQPVWSPDGKKPVFTQDGFTGLYVKNADGTGAVKVLTSADYSGFEPIWTSDSKAVVRSTRKTIVSQSITCIDV
ncbi:MAG: TolB family protein [bacterium]